MDPNLSYLKIDEYRLKQLRGSLIQRLRELLLASSFAVIDMPHSAREQCMPQLFCAIKKELYAYMHLFS